MGDSESKRFAITRDGKTHHWVVSRSRIKSLRRQSDGVLYVIRDDSEQVHLEQKLRATLAEKDKLLSLIGHDMRGSLSGLESLCEILAESDNEISPEDSLQLLQTMKESAAAASTFLEDLLTWTRIQEGDFLTPKTRVSIATSVETVKAYHGVMLRSKGVRLEEHIDPDLTCSGDRKLFETALRNLISNAIKFSPRDSIVRIRAERIPENYVLISVEDRGIGIPQKMLRTLWTLGARNGRSGTEGEVSSGLGLVLVREAVKVMGGQIDVESEEGRGSVFRLTIPASE